MSLRVICLTSSLPPVRIDYPIVGDRLLLPGVHAMFQTWKADCVGLPLNGHLPIEAYIEGSFYIAEDSTRTVYSGSASPFVHPHPENPEPGIAPPACGGLFLSCYSNYAYLCPYSATPTMTDPNCGKHACTLIETRLSAKKQGSLMVQQSSAGNKMIDTVFFVFQASYYQCRNQSIGRRALLNYAGPTTTYQAL